ncbi:MAG: TolC family protein [Archangium sp.]
MTPYVFVLVALASEPLSLGEVLSSADAMFPSLTAARADVDAAEAEVLASDGAFDPLWKTSATGVPVSGYPQVRVDSVVEAPTPLWGTRFFGGYRYGAGKFQTYYGGRETWTGGELRAGAAIPVLRNGPIDRRRANQARAALGREIAGLSVEQQRLELARLATVRYWEWVAAGRKREIAKSLLNIAVERDSQLRTRAGVGDVAQFDQQDNQRALVQREQSVVSAQRGLDAASFELSLYLRDENGDPLMPKETQLPSTLPLPEDLDAPSPEEVLARRPDYQRMLNQKKQAEVELRYAKNQMLPALDIAGVVSQDLGVSPRPEADPLGKTEVEVSALLEVPLLYRAPIGRMRAAEAALARVNAQLRFAADRVSVDLRDAKNAMDAASQRIDWARQEVDVSQKLENGERKRFDLGDSTQFLVNLREQTTVEAQLREVDAVLDAHRARANLLAASARFPGQDK